MSVLPVRPDPEPGEHLYSLAHRTAVMNGLHPATLGLTARSIARRSAEPDVVERLGVTLGLNADEARAMTVDIYPRSIVGREGHRQVRNWRLARSRWICPRCTPGSEIYLRDWQLALHPLCLRCPSLLQNADASWSDADAPPDRRAIASQRRIAAALANSRVGRRHAKELRNLYRLVTLVALTADGEWPLLIGWEAEVRRELEEHYVDWIKEPPGRPGQAAVLVLECARALADLQLRRRMTQEGWERLRAHPKSSAFTRSASWKDVLPDPGVNGPSDGIPVWDRDLWREYRALCEDLSALQSEAGLRASHVPGWDLWAGEILAPPQKVRSGRVDLAVATHMLLSGPVHNASTERRSRIALGVAGHDVGDAGR